LQSRAQEANSAASDLNSDDHPMARQIKSLGNQLDKVMIKYNEAVEMKKTYDVIVTRLGEERTVHEKHLQQVEQALKKKNSSIDELIKLSQLAMKAREQAERSLSKAHTKGPKDISMSADLQFDLNDPGEMETISTD